MTGFIMHGDLAFPNSIGAFARQPGLETYSIEAGSTLSSGSMFKKIN